MTVSSQTSKNIYVADSATTIFPYAFRILDANEILVQQLNIATGAVTTITTGFSVTGVNVGTGGTIVFDAAPLTGLKIILLRDMDFVQETHYTEYSALPASALEENMDALVMMVQQLKEVSDRSFRTDASTGSILTFPNPAGSAGLMIVVNSTGDGFVYQTVPSGGGGGGGGAVNSVTGTANRITITGTTSAPIVNIASTYAGQASITTIGTLAAGAIAESLLTFTDNTTGDVSSSMHGFVPKLPNSATRYLDGTGAFSTPAGSGGGSGPPFDNVGISGNTISITNTNGNLTLAANGTGYVVLGQTSTSGVKLAADQPIVDSSGNEFIKFVKTASAINEITIINAATGHYPIIRSSGEGHNGLIFQDASSNVILYLTSAASATNYISLTSSADGINPNLAVNQTGATAPGFDVYIPSGIQTLFSQTAGAGASLRLSAANSNNYVGLVAPATIGTSKAWTLPITDGAGYVPKSDGSGVLTMVDPATLIAGATANSASNGRLTLTTVVPVTISDVSAATTLYYTPFKGNTVATYDSSVWTPHTLSEISITNSGLTSSKLYDVFIYYTGSALALELLVWTNDTTRATALVMQDGVLCKTGALTRRYVGTVYVDASTKFNDTVKLRNVWNFTNQAEKKIQVTDTTDSWTYSTAGFRQANASTANQIEVITGYQVNAMHLEVKGLVSSSTVSFTVCLAGIGVDSTSADSSNLSVLCNANATVGTLPAAAVYRAVPSVGRHVYAWLESASGSATQTWYGDAGGVGQTGMSGHVWC